MPGKGAVMLAALLAAYFLGQPSEVTPAPPARVDYTLADPARGLAEYLASAALVPAVNVLYWLPGKYVLRDYFADISFDTMRGNIRHGWVFDDDLFAINQF